ncbi:hypothetical protein H3221_013380 [Pseudomonas sp. LMG 31766]|uniref:DUF7210 domain-containing protein n=1 Tax=Pseudomonas chaetocerotis TaxID=2758695 RepID=A0A931GBI8_9PSED|nr:hypothetical protein [Pseudomonas chaetocerotis]MBZ9665743.1 hypothetical protein [Pseudomonas chaetocerotis]
MTTKKATKAETNKPDLVEVTLAKPHTHGRQRLQAGAKIEVTAQQKAWLEKQGVVGGQQEEVSNG